MAHACGHCGKQHDAYVTVCPVTGARLGSASYTLVNDDEMLVGTVVAERYHVRDILGQGSTGTVFGIEHLAFGRSAAMKVLRPRHASPESVRQVFHSETRAALGITHPSLCEVFDIGTLPDGAPFFVMERLEGDTLASRLGRERFSAAAAVDMMMQLLSGMDALHERQILLRNLRPQNVFLAQRRGCRPIVKLLDVGLSRLSPLERVHAEWDTLRAVTSAADVTGLLAIPYYLSPERARGEHGTGPSSDIFVAAVILYEALTGQKPFAAPSWNGLLQQIAAARPTPLAVLRPDLPEPLGELLTRALDADPRARPMSAREMQDELRGVFDEARRSSARVEAVDEASADHPLRTVPPPRPVPGAGLDAGATTLSDGEIDVDLEMEEPAATSRGSELETTVSVPAPWKRPAQEDEETATMELSDELRARIEQLTKLGPPSSIEDSSQPPPTRRAKPPGVR